jgi:hypothetical protein
MVAASRWLIGGELAALAVEGALDDDRLIWPTVCPPCGRNKARNPVVDRATSGGRDSCALARGLSGLSRAVPSR